MGLASILRQEEEVPNDVLPRREFSGSDSAAGLELGLRGMQSSAYELINDPAAAAYARAQAAGVPARFRSSDDVDWTSPSDVIDYAQQNAGQFAPSAGLSLAGAGLGAGLTRTVLGAAAENLTKAQLAERAAQMATGARVGSTVASGAQQYGDMAGELRAQGKEPGAGTVGLAAIGGLSETFALENLFKGLVASAGKDAIDAAAKSGLASRVLQGTAAGIGKAELAEVPTEVFQEGLAITNRAMYDPAYREKTDDMWNRAKETAIATAAGAGLMGAAPGAMGGLRSTPPTNTETRTDERGNTTTITTTGEMPPSSGETVLDRVRGTPAPSHDMTLEELRALDSSTSSGETYGESQNAAKESTLPPNETGQRQEVLKGAGASAPATSIVDATGGMQKYGYHDFGPLKEKKAFILHHTGPYAEKDGGIDSIQQVFGQRQFPAHYVIDRKGQVYQTLPDGSRGQHIKGTANLTELGKRIGANNSNSIGVEIMANDDNDVTPAQVEAANKLRASLGFSKEQVFGHGELNSHKQKTEGHRAALAIRGGADPDLTGFGKAAASSRPRGQYDDLVDRAAQQYGVDPDDLRAMMAQESQGNPNATSNKGAGGLMQLMPGTAREQGVTDLYDPEQNIFGGAKYYRKMLDMFGGNKELAWAAYNAGPGAVQKYGNMIPPFAETQNYVKKVKGNYDSIISGRVQSQQRAANPAATAAENAELARRRTAEEPTYQSTKLGLAYRDGVLDEGTEKTGQVDSDDPFRLGATEDEFTLTFKGKKQESRGDDVFKPARPLPETGDDTFEGVTTESTPVRAFTQLYPAAKVTETSDPTDYSKVVSVTLPKTDARDDNEAKTAGRVFEALISGTKDKVEKKIKLEHPDVLSKDSGNPIEIPVTRDGLAKIGRALDPGAYDSAPSASYAAAMSGLTHLIYDKGFTPRGVDTSKPNALEAWVKQQVGEQPVDRAPERVTPEQEDRKVTGQVMGSARAEGQTPAPEVGGFTGEEPAPRVEYESKPGYTPVQQAALNHITTEAKRIQQALGPEATDEERVRAWESAVNQVVRQTNPATITVAPETAHYELGADGKPQRVVTQSDTDGAPGNPGIDAAVLGREFESPKQARQALASAGYESLPQLKGPRQFIATKEANKSTFRLVKTPEGKFRLTTADRATPGLERPRNVTRRDLIQGADLAKREFSSALYARRMNAERDQINQEAGNNVESMPLRDELTEDQTLATEGQIGVAEDRAAMAQRQRGLTSSFSPAEAKDQTRRSAENAINRVEDTAKRTRELDNQSIETVHKVSGGATVRATGVSDKVVKFFTEALKNIGLEVPLRVMGKAGISQHLEALQQRIDGLVEAITREEEALQRMPNMLKEEKKARKEQEKKVSTLRRAFQDANTEQSLLMQAMEDEFAARVIYNDHYLDAARRTPVIVISDEAMSSKNLNIVLAHELGHVVQRAWFDQLPADLQKDIIKELSQDGRYTDDIAEAFADKFMEWYRLNERAQKVRNKQNDIQSSGMGKALRRLADALKRLWNNLVGHDNAFARRYPKFDEFLRSTVGVYGRMKPINSRINKLWTESLAQPYGGLPLVAADSTQFNNMTAGEFAQTVVDGAKAGIDRAARYAENKAGENVVGQRYIRKTNETVDAFKKTAAIALMADGTWLRNAGNGILAGYANIVAPIKGRVMTNMQVVPKTLVRPALSAREPAVYASTEAMNGSIQTLSDQQYGAWRKKLDPILTKVSKLSPTDYKALVEDLRDETTPSKTPIAREIRKYFAEMLMYMRHHDVKVGARSGYYTKAWDQEKLTDNKDAVIESFEKVFAARDELPVDPRVEVREGQESVKFSTPLAAALHEYQRITEGRVDNLFEQTEEDVDPELRGPSFRYARKRMFTNEEYEQFDLNRWLNDDIAWTMNTYTQLGIKRAVQQQATGIPRAQLRNPVTRRYWEQRFTKAKLRPEVMGSPVASLELLLAEGVQDGRLPYDEYVEAKKRIMSVMGLTNVGSNPRWRRWTNRILAYETLLTMTWSSFAQLADFGISVWRADSMDRVGKVIGQIMDKRTRAEQQELLNTIGLSLDELTRHALNSGLMTTDPMAKGTQWLTEKFFKLNGMHFLSESNLMFASMLGQSYIKDYADKAVNAKTLEERDEAMKRLRELHPTLSPADALTGDFAANPLLQQALHEYVSQSHLHNQIGYTPRIFNDYRFAVFTQLKGFMFKYHNIVLRQMWERMKDRPDLLQAAIPMLTLAMATMPLAFVGMEAKEALRRRLFPKVKRAPKDKTPMQKFHDVLMASGMPGAYVGLFDSALEAPQHGQPGIVALAGPTVGHAFNISSRTADEWIPSSIPLVSSVPWVRSMARQGLRDTFGFGVRDEE